MQKLSQQLHTTICIVNEAAQLAEQLQRRGIDMLSLVDAFELYVVEASDRSKAMQQYWDDVHAGRIQDPRYDADNDDDDGKDDDDDRHREPEKRESSVKRTAKNVANNSKAALQTASTQVKSWASKQSKKRWDDFKTFAHTLFNDDHLTMYSR